MKRFRFPYHKRSLVAISHLLPAMACFDIKPKRYARACSSYEFFVLRAMRLSNKLFGLIRKSSIWSRSILWSYQTICNPPRRNATWHSWGLTPSISPTCDLVPNWILLPYLTFYPIAIEALRRMWHANRWLLLMRTPRPVLLWDFYVFLCWDKCLPNLSCFPTFEFRTSLGTSILLRAFWANQSIKWLS